MVNYVYMINKKIMLEKLHSLVSSAQGCTEIGVIGYATASASKLMGNPKNSSRYKKIEVEVSPFIFKNVFRVGVPNLGQCGIKMIISTAAAIAKPERKLEIFETVSREEKRAGKELVEDDKVTVRIGKNVNPVYAKVTITGTDGTIYEAVISHYHDHIVYVKKNNKYIVNNRIKHFNEVGEGEIANLKNVTLKDIINFVNSCKLSDLKFLGEISKANDKIAEYGLKNVIKDSFTDNFIKLISKRPTLNEKIILYTGSAIDARMNGAPLQVTTSSGSGDHGLCCSIPQYQMHIHTKNEEIVYLRGLALANMIIWIVKKNIGNLSALCGSVVAAVTGTLCGLAYQRGMNIYKINDLIDSALCSFALTICDGAKMSCTHKVCFALKSGLLMLDMIDKGYYVKPKDGIITGNAFGTIKIFNKLSKDNINTLNNSIIESIFKIDEQ